MNNDTTCQWYLLCENTATATRHHIILGDVPICDRCEDKARGLENVPKPYVHPDSNAFISWD